MHAPLISILFPLPSDPALMEQKLRALAAALQTTPHEILALYDHTSNLAALDSLPNRPKSLRFLKCGPGPKAFQSALRLAAGDILITLNENLLDPYDLIPAMAEIIRTHHAAVVVASRPEPFRLRHFLVNSLAGLNSKDITTQFRAYDANFLDTQQIESPTHQTIPFELTVKAHQSSLLIEEIPIPQKSPPIPSARGDVHAYPDTPLRPFTHWLALLLQAPILVWSIWLLMSLLLLTHALSIAPSDPLGHITNVFLLAAGAFALTLAVRRVRIRTRFADAFFSFVLLSPFIYTPQTRPFDQTLLSTSLLALMTGAIVAMKRGPLLRYFAVTGLAVALTAVSANFVMILPALIIWLLAAGFLVARNPGEPSRKSRRRGFAIMAAGEVILILFGLACLLEPATPTPSAKTLFPAIVSFIDFPLLVLALLLLALGWRKGPHANIPPHFAGMLALLVGLLTMLLNNFQEGLLRSPGADQTLLVLCLVYIVSALHGPRRLQWLTPPLLLLCAIAYTLLR